ncbi:LysR family transcriptional regulator [Kocuria varians]|uniref:LysR family transcriptional regulator n=1 Tax=Kocuria varians TaxID=1272 RepID=A0A4Y4D6S2_KOCVA|nr:RidA family protein [Kocuria varians]GEC98997.1 LysR family transcriptional regulator [Kocuria varians]
MSDSYEDRLAELGLQLPEVAAPLAAYAPAVTSGNHVYTAGQLPLVSGALLETGVVAESGEPGTVSPQRAAALAERCALNALAAVKSRIGQLERIRRIVKVTGFVASAPDFYGQPAVVDGASALLGRVFGDAGEHARSAVGVSVLPLNSPVEVELIVEFA